VANPTNPESALAALAAHLGTRRFVTDLRADGLHVKNPEMQGCCDGVRRASDTITCRPREADGGRLWFWTSWGEPIAEADQVINASVTVLGNLAHRHGLSR